MRATSRLAAMWAWFSSQPRVRTRRRQGRVQLRRCVPHQQGAVGAYVGDDPAVAVLDPVGAADPEPPVVAAGDHHFTAVGRAAMSKLFIARTGFRGNNDLVWVGNAANNAAEMAAHDPTYLSYISSEVYSRLNEESKYGGEPKRHMWMDLGTRDLGYQIYGFRWTWSP